MFGELDGAGITQGLLRVYIVSLVSWMVSKKK